MSRRNRGFTLTETVVATVLLGLATTIMAVFMLDFSRQAARYEHRQELIAGAERVVLRLTSLLGDSRSSLVTYDSTIAGAYFPVAKANGKDFVVYDASGNLLWQRWVAFGLARSSVFEASLSIATPTADPTALAKTLTSAPSTWKRRSLANSVQLLSLTGPTNSAFRVRVVVKDSLGYQAELASTVQVRN